MTVALVSSSADFYRLCRAILAELGQVELIAVRPDASLPTANLFLWDYSREFDLSRVRLAEASQHVVLVDREDLAHCSQFPAGAMFLVKPLDRVVFSQWLSAAVSASSKNGDSGAPGKTNPITGQEHDWRHLVATGLHDFGAPLTAASGYCELLLAEEFGPLGSRQSEILGRMRNSLARLGRMTSDMFEKSARPRALSGSSPSPVAGFQIAAQRSIAPRPRLDQSQMEHCVEQAIHEVDLFAASKRLQVVTFLAPPTRAMHFDRCQLEQVLSNLLDNACKFAHDGGRIEINGYPVSSERRCASVPQMGLKRRPGFASPQVSSPADCNSFESGCNYFRIDVFNTGPAIAPELLDRIFDEYATFVVNESENRSIRSAETSPKKSAEKSAERGSGGRAGAGLGLAICKRIVEQHRGKIWAENRPEGPMISFLLPLSGNGRNFTFDSTQEPKLVASVRRRPHWREIGASRPYAG